MPDDKKKQAMSLLFGDAPSRPDAEPKASPSKRKASKSVAKTTSRQSDQGTQPTAKPASSVTPRPKPKKTSKPQSAPPEADVTPDPYYQGASRYRRAGGDQVKHSVYLDPDVSQAIKVAAAMGDDPRGTNVSAIVNQALRDSGYGPTDQ